MGRQEMRTPGGSKPSRPSTKRLLGHLCSTPMKPSLHRRYAGVGERSELGTSQGFLPERNLNYSMTGSVPNGSGPRRLNLHSHNASQTFPLQAHNVTIKPWNENSHGQSRSHPSRVEKCPHTGGICGTDIKHENRCTRAHTKTRRDLFATQTLASLCSGKEH